MTSMPFHDLPAPLLTGTAKVVMVVGVNCYVEFTHVLGT